MTETKEPEDKKSLSLSSRPRRLELKKTVEAGQVRQSFSHGRSKAVTVEVRKKRPIGGASGAPSAQGAASAPSQTAATPQQGRGPARGRVVLKQLTEEEKQARARALDDSRRADAEARRVAIEDAKRRAVDDARAAEEREAAARRVAEEEARKKTEEDARRRAEEEASRRLATEAAAPGGAAEAPGVRPVAATAEEEDEARKARPGVKAPHRPAPARTKSEPRRRGAKLTISQALTEEERVRSLASFRRAREREKRLAQGFAKGRDLPKKVLRDVVVPETITVQELANRMAERGTDVIRALMKMGVMAAINESIDADTAELVVQEFGHRVRRVSEADVEVGLGGEADKEEFLEPRAPVVTVMGHVDHGKTSLLDALRAADVASREAGGITQHIGAYQVTLQSGARITFLDTPGHEAFTAMRARGAKVTDIVVLVVAADDSVMPQTVEAIRHAKAANVPIVVAINKIDKPGANPDKVRQQLLQHSVAAEEMGGDVLMVEVSAKTRAGLDKLEEAILLQAELLDLKANPNRPAEGAVIEAKLDRGRGAVATVLIERGTVKVGDVFVAGAEWGRVRALIDDRGTAVDSAGPAAPVEVLGLQGTPEAGDGFMVVQSETRAREISAFRQRRQRDARAVAGARGTLEEMFSKIKAGEVKELAVVVKADVQGSLEAILGAGEKLGTEEVAVRVLHGAVGGINESDVTLAKASNGLVIGFNVRANKQARESAARDHVDIRYYSVIYDVINDFKSMLTTMLAPMVRETFLGNAEVREVFAVSKVGKVAGCLVTEGHVHRGSKVRLLRDNVVIYAGALATLKRFKDDVRDVKQGTECGIALENYNDIQVGDVIECFDVEEVARQL